MSTHRTVPNFHNRYPEDDSVNLQQASDFYRSKTSVSSQEPLSCKNNRGSKIYNYQFLRMSSTIPGTPSFLGNFTDRVHFTS